MMRHQIIDRIKPFYPILMILNMRKIMVLFSSTMLLLTACQSTQPNPNNISTSTVTISPKIALVLGGGGARGFAHIGVIKALEANGIRPNLIVGTSSGAMVGAIYASGKRPSELEQIALNMDDTALLDMTISKQGIIEGQALANFINQQVGHQPLEQLPITFVPVATQMHTGISTAFQTGDTGQAVRASASVPNVFIPPRIPASGGQKYIDGGRSALLPSRIAKELGADVIIAVDIMSDPSPKSNNTPNETTVNIHQQSDKLKVSWGDQTASIPFHPDIWQAVNTALDINPNSPISAQITLPPTITSMPTNTHNFWQLFETQTFNLANLKADDADLTVSDVVITPKLGQYLVIDTGSKSALIDAGYQATLAQINSIKTAIAQHQN